MGTYDGREQTKAKHFILRTYLQALAFKVLGGPNGWPALTYIDGFSGPWQTRKEDHSDSSFMIAVQVLKDAQERIREQTGVLKTVRCFFSESDPNSFEQLEATVRSHHNPSEQFCVETFSGTFEEALPRTQDMIGNSFALYFIDPTGWTGYPLEKLKPYISPRDREVLVNFMYGHISRFVESDDPKTVASLAPILGGEGWKDRLNADLPKGLAVEELFRETLKAAGDFEYVLSTCIDRPTEDRPNFFLAYGTKALAGLKAFREAEAKAMRVNYDDRARAKRRKRDELENTSDLFANEDVGQPVTFDDLIEDQMALAQTWVIDLLESIGGSMAFDDICADVMQAFMLRETNVKDVCVRLHKAGRIQQTWPSRGKPKSGVRIELAV